MSPHCFRLWETSHFLSHCWLRPLTNVWVTRPQKFGILCKVMWNVFTNVLPSAQRVLIRVSIDPLLSSTMHTRFPVSLIVWFRSYLRSNSQVPHFSYSYPGLQAAHCSLRLESKFGLYSSMPAALFFQIILADIWTLTIIGYLAWLSEEPLFFPAVLSLDELSLELTGLLPARACCCQWTQGSPGYWLQGLTKRD